MLPNAAALEVVLMPEIRTPRHLSHEEERRPGSEPVVKLRTRVAATRHQPWRYRELRRHLTAPGETPDRNTGIGYADGVLAACVIPASSVEGKASVVGG
jgi:hypothetical protein